MSKSARTAITTLLLLVIVSFSFEIDWIRHTSKLPIPLTEACISITSNNTIYIFGGYTENLVLSQKIYSFNPSTNTIYTLNITTPTTQFICRNHNSVYSNITHKIYIIGIYTNDTDDLLHTTKNYEFNPLTLEFTPIPNAASRLEESCVAIYDSSIFVYGGWNFIYGGAFVSTLFIYDVLTKQWTQKASSPDTIFDGACYAFNGKFYSIGGWNPDDVFSLTGGVINDILRYDLETNAWSEINTLAYYKWGMKAVGFNAMDDTVIIIGGYGLLSQQYNSYKIEAYNYKDNVVISDIGELEDEIQGGLMVTPYMDNIMVLGGNSYWLPEYDMLPNAFYDGIYISNISSNIPTHDPVTESTKTIINNSNTTMYLYPESTVITSLIQSQTNNTFFGIPKIAFIAIVLGCAILGILCVGYLFYTKRKNEVENATNSTHKLAPPGIGGEDDEEEMDDNEHDKDEGVQSSIDNNIGDNRLNEALIMPSNRSHSNDKAADTQELKNWLQVHQLDCYLDNFVMNGYASLSFVKDINDVSALVEVGIHDKDHQIKLITAIKDLNEHMNNDIVNNIAYEQPGSYKRNITAREGHMRVMMSDVKEGHGEDMKDDAGYNHQQTEVVLPESTDAKQNETVGTTHVVDIEGRDEVKHWLEFKVELVEYYDYFVNNGMDSLKLIKTIEDKSDLEHLGIVMKGHQIVILKKIKELKSQDKGDLYIDDVKEEKDDFGQDLLQKSNIKTPSAMHLEILEPNDIKNMEKDDQKEDVILDVMLNDIVEMQNVDPHKMNDNEVIIQKKNKSDSDDSDDMYQK